METISTSSVQPTSTKDFENKVSLSTSSSTDATEMKVEKQLTSSVEVPEDERGPRDFKMEQPTVAPPNTTLEPTSTVAPPAEKTDLQGALGKVTCVNVTAAVSELR